MRYYPPLSSGTDANAIHDNQSGEINALALKSSLLSTDLLIIEDSAAAYAKKKTRIGDLPSSTGGGDMLKSTYDPALISEQLVGLTATQTLTNKTLTSPTINSPSGLVKADVGLASVDNTSDLDKPISTATQSALNLKEDLSNKLTAFQATPDDTHYASEKLVYDSLACKQDAGNYFDKTADSLDDISDGATYSRITATNLTDLTDSGDSILHYHATDRDRANHTGSQLAATISDFDIEVSNNVDVTANTTHRGRTDNPHAVTSSLTSTDTTNFGNNLSTADNTVQKALDTLDDISINVDEIGVLYVGKHGSDTNTGHNIKDAFLTFSAAIAAAAADSVIVCLDVGVYNEDINLTRINIFAPNATIRGDSSLSTPVILANNDTDNFIIFNKIDINKTTASYGIDIYGGQLKCNKLKCSRENIAIHTRDASTVDIQIDIDYVSIYGDKALLNTDSISTLVAEETNININKIYIDLSTYYGGYLFVTINKSISGFVGKIETTGAAGKCSLGHARVGDIRLKIANYTRSDFNADYRYGTEIIDYGDSSDYIYTDTTNFNNNLSSVDDTVQKALDTLDDISYGKSYYEVKSYTIQAEIKVASGDVDVIPPFEINLKSGQTCKIVKWSGSIGSGTSATLKLQKSDGIGGAFADITGFTGLVVSGGFTNPTSSDPTDVSLSDGEVIQPVVTAVSGTPTNLMLNIVLEYTI